jgi:membrane protease subunit HflK
LNIRALLLIVGAAVAFSWMAIPARSAGAPILTVAAWRAIFVALSFAAWTLLEGRGLAALRLERPTLRMGVFYGLALALASATYTGAYALTTVPNTAFFHSLAPVAAFPLAYRLFGERPGGRALIGTGLAVLGVGLLSGVSILHFTEAVNPRFLLGDLLALLSGFGYGAVLVCTRAARTQGLPVLPVLTVAWTVAALVLVPLALVTGQLSLPLSGVPWVLGLALVCTTLPFYLLNVALRQVPAGVASLVAMSEVLFATVLGFVFYGETVAPIGWLGGLFVLLGIGWPFFGEEGVPAAEVPQLSPAARGPRLGRLGIRLLLFNGGAAMALLEGHRSGMLLAWLALASAASLGHPLLREAAGVRWAGALRAGLGGLGLLLLLALVWRGGWDDPSPSLLVAGAAGLALLADAWLRGAEPEGERADDLVARLGLLGCLLGAAAGAAGHPAAGLLLGGAGLLTTLSAVLLGADALNLSIGEAVRRRLRPAGGPRLVLGLVLLLLVTGGLRVVPAGHVAVIERLGRPIPEPSPAGLLTRLPPPFERSTVVDVARVRRVALSGTEATLLTGDQALVSVQASLVYTVSEPVSFVLGSADPEAALVRLGRASLVETVARLSLDAVLTRGRAGLEGRVAELTRRAAEAAGLGVKVEAVELLHVGVPAPVTAAFLDVTSAEEHQKRLVNEAEAYAARVVPAARGGVVAAGERARGAVAGTLARAEGRAALIFGLTEGGSPAPGITVDRARHEQMIEILAPRRLLIVPSSVTVWAGGAAASAPIPTKGAK